MSAVAALLLSLIGSDRLGDPLGPGLTARYGTNRLCAGRVNTGELRFHPIRDELYLCPNGSLKNPDEGKRGIHEARGWKLPSGAEVFRHRISPDRVALDDIVFDPTGRYRLMTYLSESRVWDDSTRREFAAVSLPDRLRRSGGIVGFRDGRVTARSSTDGGGGKPGTGVDVVESFRVSDSEPTGGEVWIGETSVIAPSPCGKWLWTAEERLREIRGFSADSGTIRSWRRAPTEDDVDPDQFTKASIDGRKLFTIQCRQIERADRYRGYPECFVQVFDTASNRVEARYAFRLDDIGTDLRLKPPEDGEQEFRDFLPSNDGKFLAWTDELFRLRIRHLPTGRVVTIPVRELTRCPMAFSLDGKRLAVCGYDGVVLLIDPYTGRFQNAADNPPTAAKQTAISPDGKLVATGHACGEVWVWDAVTGKPLWHTEPDGEPVREVHFNPTGTTVSAVGFWGPIGVRTWNAKTGKELGPMLPYRYFRTIAVSADGKRIADLIEEKSVMENGKWAYPLFVRTREVATGKELGRVRLDHRLGLSNETNAVVSRDGRVMVVTHNADGGETIAYDTATGKRLARLQEKRSEIQSWQLGSDGRSLLHAYIRSPEPSSIRLMLSMFDLTSESPQKPLTELDLNFRWGPPVLSADGRYAALGIERDEAVYDLRSGWKVRELSCPVAAFFPDGTSVLTLPGIRGAERVSLEPLAWKVAPPARPSEARLKQLWTQLGEPAALDAVFELARHSAEAVPFLKSKLITDPPDAKAVAVHVERLGSKLFAEREAASKALRELGPEVLPALRAALKAGPSPEVRSRLEKLIAVHADTATPFTLARLRAVEVLERCDTPDAHATLKTLANTRPGTPWADDAARALMRTR